MNCFAPGATTLFEHNKFRCRSCCRSADEKYCDENHVMRKKFPYLPHADKLHSLTRTEDIHSLTRTEDISKG